MRDEADSPSRSIFRRLGVPVLVGAAAFFMDFLALWFAWAALDAAPTAPSCNVAASNVGSHFIPSVFDRFQEHWHDALLATGGFERLSLGVCSGIHPLEIGSREGALMALNSIVVE